jgi:glycosyltransferase involved in cell wall biosynthesis
MPKIVANILCHNELVYLRSLIPKVAKICDEIIVVDDLSSDGSKEYLESWPIITRIERKFELNFSDQRNAALSLVQDGDWVFRIDADEIPSENLMVDFKESLSKIEAQGVDRIQIPIYHLVTFGMCLQETGCEIRLFKKNSSCLWHKQFHEEIRASFEGGLLKFPSWNALLHFKYMDANRIKYTREFFVQNGLYDKDDLERRINENISFLPPFLNYELSGEFKNYICSNRF